MSGSWCYANNSTEVICYEVVEKIMKTENTDVMMSGKLDLDNASAIC